MAGKLSEYSKPADWDENQVLSMVSSLLRNNKAAKIGLDEMYKQEWAIKRADNTQRESIIDG